MDILVDLYEYLTRQLRKIHRKVVELSRTSKYSGRAKLLRTAPGVGVLTGMEVLVELQDMGRFQSAEEVASYLGLIYPVHQGGRSGESERVLKEIHGKSKKIISMQRIADYDAISCQYDCRYRVRDFRGVEEALLRFVGTVESSRLLEVGCGTGHWLKFLEKQGRQPIGIDASKKMLLLARESLPGAPFVKGRAENLPFPDSRFDRLFCINALHHFVNKVAFLAEARRVLRPSGGFMTVGLDPHTGLDKWWVYDYFPETVELDKGRYPSSGEIIRAMGQCGFIRCEANEAEHIRATMSARLADSEGFLDRSFTSQLTILSKEEYENGLSRLNQAIKESTGIGDDLLLRTDLRLYAVVGSVG